MSDLAGPACALACLRSRSAAPSPLRGASRLAPEPPIPASSTAATSASPRSRRSKSGEESPRDMDIVIEPLPRGRLPDRLDQRHPGRRSARRARRAAHGCRPRCSSRSTDQQHLSSRSRPRTRSGSARSRDPMRGDPVRWASIDGPRMHVYSFMVAGGRHVRAADLRSDPDRARPRDQLPADRRRRAGAADLRRTVAPIAFGAGPPDGQPASDRRVGRTAARPRRRLDHALARGGDRRGDHRRIADVVRQQQDRACVSTSRLCSSVRSRCASTRSW